MHYAGLALKFIAKNILHLTAFAILPAVALAFYYRNSSFFTLIRDIFYMDVPINSYFYYSLISKENWFYAIAVLILIIFIICLIFAYLYRTMKVGGKSLIMPFKKINETIIPVFLVFITMFALIQLFALFSTNLVDLLLRSSPTIYRIFIPLVLIVLYSVLFCIFLTVLMCIPVMLITGYKYKEALAYSIRLSSGKLLKFAFACLFPIVILMGLGLLLNFLTQNMALQIIMASFSIYFILMYYPTLMMTTYYEITGMNRMDIKRRPIYY